MDGQPHFGQWLKDERQKRHWKQIEFARKAGESRSMIWKFENGTAMPSTKTFMQLAKALNLSPMTLFREAGLWPETSQQKMTLEDWENLLSQLPLNDQEELREIAILKLNRLQKTKT